MVTAGVAVARRRLTRRLIGGFNAKILNPPTRLALELGIAPKAFALLETRGRRSGKLRRQPVGNGLIGGEFWLVAQSGLDSGYVKNLLADPCVRVKVGRRWYSGKAEVVAGDDWQRRLDKIGHALGAMRRLDARLLRWFIRVLGTRPVTVRVELNR